MKINLKGFVLFTGLTILFQINSAQTQDGNEPDEFKTYPLFSGLHTLSIHVKDTITHDSVFHFLVNELKLPVYYFPVKFGSRKYAGVYSGNLVIEPCGPYSNITYATNNFRAIFYGFTFEPLGSLAEAKNGLENRRILHNQIDNTFIYLQNDTALCGDNMTISFMDRTQKTVDKKIMDSLRYVMNSDVETKYKVYNVYTEQINKNLQNHYTEIHYYNGPGIEYVQDICVGYVNNLSLKKWKEFIRPSELTGNYWECDSLLGFHFVESNIKEVQSITFKVKSLEQTKRYFSSRNFNWNNSDNKIKLNSKQTFGLMLYFTDTR